MWVGRLFVPAHFFARFLKYASRSDGYPVSACWAYATAVESTVVIIKTFEVGRMNISGLIRMLGCLGLCLALLNSLDTVPFGVSSAEAGAGPDAVKNQDAPDAVDETAAAAPAAPKKRSGPPPLVHTEFLTVCASCHKPDGRGGRSYGGYAANLHITELDYDGIVYIIRNGRSEKGMPPFDGVIGPRKIDAVTTYILENFKGKPVSEEHQEHSGK